MKKTSVIVPLYNAEKYAGRCIESILNQTYDNLEIILVNDGSSDSTLSICKEYQLIDNRIIVLNKKNGGVSSARNYGIKTCTGDYIGFVDSDDYIDSRMYEELVNALEENNSEIAECSLKRVLDSNSLRGYEFENEIIAGNYSICASSILQINTFPSVCNKIFKKELFDDIRFPNYKYGEDYYVLVLCSYYANRKIIIPYIGYFYYFNEDSAVNKEFSGDMLDDIKSSEELYNFFITQSSHPKLSNHLALHIVIKVLGLYRNALKSNYSNKKQVIQYLTQIFQKYISYVSDDLLKLIPRKRFIYTFSIKIFKFNPQIFQYIVKFIEFYQKKDRRYLL